MSESTKPLGQRKTKQRQLILSIIQQAQGPLSVNEIAAKLEESEHNIGIATIYRTVNLLLDNELLQCVRLQDAVQRYEPANIPHHHHFSCRVCDKVYDIKGCFLHLHEPQLNEGHAIESHEITFTGVCATCQTESTKA